MRSSRLVIISVHQQTCLFSKQMENICRGERIMAPDTRLRSSSCINKQICGSIMTELLRRSSNTSIDAPSPEALRTIIQSPWGCTTEGTLPWAGLLTYPPHFISTGTGTAKRDFDEYFLVEQKAVFASSLNAYSISSYIRIRWNPIRRKTSVPLCLIRKTEVIWRPLISAKRFRKTTFHATTPRYLTQSSRWNKVKETSLSNSDEQNQTFHILLYSS